MKTCLLLVALTGTIDQIDSGLASIEVHAGDTTTTVIINTDQLPAGITEGDTVEFAAINKGTP